MTDEQKQQAEPRDARLKKSDQPMPCMVCGKPVRIGVAYCDVVCEFNERLKASETLWVKWLAAHPRGVSVRLEQDRASKSAFTAGVMMGIGWAGRKSAT